MTFEQWQATGRDVDDLAAHEIEDSGPGRVYEGLCFMNRLPNSWHIIIGNQEVEITTLPDAEKYLWDNWAKGELAGDES